MNIDSLIFAKWVIPVQPENTIYEDYALAIDNGQILELIPAKESCNKYKATETHHLDNHAIIPWLINSHTHAAMSLFKGLADDLLLSDWLKNRIWPAESKWVNSKFVSDGAKLAVAEMIRGGTTCFNDMYFFPDITAKIASEAGMRASVGLIIIDSPTAWAKNTQEYFEKGEIVHDSFKHNPLIQTAFAPHSPYTVSEKSLMKISVLAEELDIPIHMHIHETEFEINQSLKKHGLTPLQYLEKLGILSQRLQAIHMTQLDTKAIELVAHFNINVIHCAESNLKLATGFCPVHQLEQANVNVAIGTDGSASNNDLDMMGEMRTAALIGKGISKDPAALSAMTILKMATINGAKALDIDAVTGSLTPGKSADITAIDLGVIETLPIYNPISHIVYASNRNQVTDVWVAGKQLLKHRGLTTLDIDQIKESTKTWNDKIK